MNKAKESLKKYYHTERRKLSTSSSIAVQITCSIFSFVPFLSAFLLVELYCNYTFVFISLATFGSVGIVLGSFLLNYVYQKRFIFKWWQKILLTLVVLILEIIPMIILAFVFNRAKIDMFHLITISVFRFLFW